MNDNSEYYDDIITLHEDILDENEEGVEEILADFKDQPEVLTSLCTDEIRVDTDPEWGMSAIHRAAAVGNISILSMLLGIDSTLDCNIKIKSNGLTPLHMSTWEGQTAMVSFLASNGADVNMKDKKGRTALHIASDIAHSDVAAILIVKGAKLDSLDNVGFTPLHYAAQRGTTSMINLLIKRGASVDIQDNLNQTALHKVLKSSRTDALACLLSNGASSDIKDSQGNTPLHLAIGLPKKSKTDFRKKRSSFDVNTLNDERMRCQVKKSAIEQLLEAVSTRNEKNDNGETPLHFAVKYDDIEAVKLLIQFKSDIDALNNKNQTPVFLVKSVECFKLLIHRSADLTIKDIDGNTPLHLLCYEKESSSEILSLFCSESLVDCVNNSGMTPIFMACMSNDLSKVEILCSYGAALDKKDIEDNTLIHISTKSANIDILKYVLQSNSHEIDSINRYGRSPLHEALLVDNLNAAKVLLDNGADVNLVDSSEKLPSEYAVNSSNYYAALCFLLEKQAKIVNSKGYPLNVLAQNCDFANFITVFEQNIDINRKNERGRSPIHDAINSKSWNIVDFLLNADAKCNTFDEEKETVLHSAIRLCDDDALFDRILSVSKSLINVSNKDGDTVLHLAVKCNLSMNRFKNLMKLQPDLRIKNNDGYTVLHLIIINSSTDEECINKMTVVIDQAERNVCNIKDNHGRTILHHACLKQFINALEYFLESGADPTYTDFNGDTPLHSAVQSSHNEDIILYLISHEAPVNAVNKNHFSPLSLSVDKGEMIYINIFLKNGAITNDDVPLCSTSLYIALKNRSSEIVEILLGKDRGIDINTTYQDGKKAIHFAARSLNVSVVARLLNMGTPINSLSSLHQSALHEACSNPDSNVLKTLIKRGADIRIKDSNGDTPLHISAENGFYAHVDLLLTAHANGNAKNLLGQTPLHSAAKAKGSDVLELLVANEVNVNISDSNGQTPLMIALIYKNIESASVLIDQDADILAIDKKGQTALHKAAKIKNISSSLLQSLVHKSNALNEKDKSGRTPADIAKGEAKSILLNLSHNSK